MPWRCWWPQNARQGSGFTGLNASPALVAPNRFDPAFYWQNGIPAYVKGPIFDQTYQERFNSTIAGGAAGGTLTFAEPTVSHRAIRVESVPQLDHQVFDSDGSVRWQ